MTKKGKDIAVIFTEQSQVGLAETIHQSTMDVPSSKLLPT